MSALAKWGAHHYSEILFSLHIHVGYTLVPYGLPHLMTLIFGQTKQTESNREGWSFGLTLRFGLEKIPFRRLGIFRSTITIGVTEADIAFHLENAIMPDEDWALDSPMPHTLEISRERTIETGNDNSTEAITSKEEDGSFSGEAQANPKISLSAKLRQAQSEKTGLTSMMRDQVLEKYTISRCMLVASGGPSAPSWNITSFFKDQVLHGTAIKVRSFARVLPTAEDSKLSIKATIPEHALRIQDETGAFMHVNRRIIALARIRKELCRKGIELLQVKIPTVQADEDENN